MGRLICESPNSTCNTKIGGLPTAVAEFAWPQCSCCHGAMKFIAQIDFAETSIDGLPIANALIFRNTNLTWSSSGINWRSVL